MTKLLSFSILCVLTILTFKIQAQEIRVYAPPGYNYLYSSDNLPKGTEGSPYMDDWKSADIHLKSGKTINNIMVRYNVLSEQMLYKQNNASYVIGTPDSISDILLSDRTFIYKEYTKSNKTQKGFFELIYNGKVSLLNKYEIEVIRSNYNVAMDTGNKNDRLVLIQKLYLQQGDKIVPFDKKSKLIEVLQDKRNEISDYMNKEKLSTKQQQDVIKVLSYYNQL